MSEFGAAPAEHGGTARAALGDVHTPAVTDRTPPGGLSPQPAPVPSSPAVHRSGSRHLAATAARIAVLLTALAGAYLVATRWDRWTGQAAVETTDDAYLGADLTPMSARVSGHPARRIERQLIKGSVGVVALCAKNIRLSPFRPS